MSSRNLKSTWLQLRYKLLGTNPEENYIHHYKDQDEEYYEICLNGGDYSTLKKSTFDALQKRGLLRLVDGITRIQPDAWSYKYTVK